jgi:hypothetical protein
LVHYAYRIGINELGHPHIIKIMPKNNSKILAIDPWDKVYGGSLSG